jgi:hypothetical protein
MFASNEPYQLIFQKLQDYTNTSLEGQPHNSNVDVINTEADEIDVKLRQALRFFQQKY